MMNTVCWSFNFWGFRIFRQTQVEDSKHQRNRSWRLRKWVDDVQIAIFKSRISASCGRRCLNSISLSQPSHANCKQWCSVADAGLGFGQMLTRYWLNFAEIDPQIIQFITNSRLKTQLNESQWCKTAIWIDLGHILALMSPGLEVSTAQRSILPAAGGLFLGQPTQWSGRGLPPKIGQFERQQLGLNQELSRTNNYNMTICIYLECS